MLTYGCHIDIFLDSEKGLKWNESTLFHNIEQEDQCIKHEQNSVEIKESKIYQHCMITAISGLDSPDLFIQYLDKYFKPEINLCDESKDEGSLQESLKESQSQDQENIKLNYKGHKHMNDKGRNAERRDVAYKTFIRSVRRYLWEIFTKQFGKEFMKNDNWAQLYSDFVTQFYNEHFKPHVAVHMNMNAKEEENMIFILKILISDKYSFYTKSEALKRPTLLIKSLMKSFRSVEYKRFFMTWGVSELFRTMFETGFIDRIINAYPKLTTSKDSYEKIANNIANFKTTKNLLQSNLHKW